VSDTQAASPSSSSIVRLNGPADATGDPSVPDPVTTPVSPLPKPASGRPAESRLVEMPPAIRILEGPWTTLVGEVPGLTEDLERDFRFGQAVVQFAGGYRLGGSIKGGSSTIWSPVTEAEHKAYTAWQEREGIPQEEDREAFDALAKLLETYGIEFYNIGYRASTRQLGEYIASRGFLYRTIHETLEKLPWTHLARPEFARLQVGGWGPDSAKASAYDQGAVLIYEFAVRGASRTFAGLVLHEFGHVHETALAEGQREALIEAHRTIGRAYALVGLEFLLDGESRKIYQQFLVNEFVAETYVVYTSQGGFLRAFIDGQSDEEVKRAWQTVYGIFRATFQGTEYV
jgi:hypothetical protein